MNTIDISTPEKRKEVYDIFSSFNTKGKIHKYYGISDNPQGCKYIKEIAEAIGFDFNVYKQPKPKYYCKQCGKEITSKWAKDFCSSSCAATFNNSHRDKSVYEKLGDKLRKAQEKREIGQKEEIKKETKICEFCGKEFTPIRHQVRFCSQECDHKRKHIEAYKDFIENNDKYCRGNYTPKAFKKEFIEEQGGRCAICGCKPEHNNKPLVFIIDHIDGDASNNKRENLRMICPNCDSQLDTFKSKNKSSKRRNYWKEHIIRQLDKE